MLFTVKEMELICVFHAGTLSATLAALQSVAQEIELPARKADAGRVVEKLSGMNPGDPVTLAFDNES